MQKFIVQTIEFVKADGRISFVYEKPELCQQLVVIVKYIFAFDQCDRVGLKLILQRVEKNSISDFLAFAAISNMYFVS